MISRKINGIAIKALTAALPKNIADLDYFSTLYGVKEAERVAKGTGIRSIRYSDGASTTDLITAASINLLDHLSISKDEIDGLVVVTQTPDTWSPGTSTAVHKNLDLSTHCLTVDINSGCSGYVSGLIQAASLVASGACSHVLLCTGDVNTRLIDDHQHQLRMLFGDGASATLISKGEGSIQFISGTDGVGAEVLGVPLSYDKKSSTAATVNTLKMDGAAVMSFVLKRVPQVLADLLKEGCEEKENIDFFALHQPNEFILKYLRKILKLDEESLPIAIDGIGNTNSSSIPILLSKRNLENKKDKKVVLCGFGVGLSWNAMLVELGETRIVPSVEV